MLDSRINLFDARISGRLERDIIAAYNNQRVDIDLNVSNDDERTHRFLTQDGFCLLKNKGESFVSLYAIRNSKPLLLVSDELTEANLTKVDIFYRVVDALEKKCDVRTLKSYYEVNDHLPLEEYNDVFNSGIGYFALAYAGITGLFLILLLGVMVTLSSLLMIPVWPLAIPLCGFLLLFTLSAVFSIGCLQDVDNKERVQASLARIMSKTEGLFSSYFDLFGRFSSSFDECLLPNIFLNLQYLSDEADIYDNGCSLNNYREGIDTLITIDNKVDNKDIQDNELLLQYPYTYTKKAVTLEGKLRVVMHRTSAHVNLCKYIEDADRSINTKKSIAIDRSFYSADDKTFHFISRFWFFDRDINKDLFSRRRDLLARHLGSPYTPLVNTVKNARSVHCSEPDSKSPLSPEPSSF